MIAEDYRLAQDPAVENDSYCGDLTATRTLVTTVLSFADEFIDLQQEFVIDSDIFGGDVSIDMFAYEPEQSGIGDDPILYNQTAMNGVYADLNSPGHGFNLHRFDGGTALYYCGHTAMGERLWLLSKVFRGDFQFGVPVELEWSEVLEGVFFNSEGQLSTWGTITLTFTGCDSGTAELDGLDGVETMNFSRLVGLEGTDCESFR